MTISSEQPGGVVGRLIPPVAPVIGGVAGTGPWIRRAAGITWLVDEAVQLTMAVHPLNEPRVLGEDLELRLYQRDLPGASGLATTRHRGSPRIGPSSRPLSRIATARPHPECQGRRRRPELSLDTAGWGRASNSRLRWEARHVRARMPTRQLDPRGALRRSSYRRPGLSGRRPREHASHVRLPPQQSRRRIRASAIEVIRLRAAESRHGLGLAPDGSRIAVRACQLVQVPKARIAPRHPLFHPSKPQPGKRKSGLIPSFDN